MKPEQKASRSGNNIVIIGGGAAGMAAALFAAEAGASVTLLEQNEKLGKKLFITGKGRCNFTNACDRQELSAHVVTNPRFLYSAFAGFGSRDAIALFERLGVPTKVERGRRAFPASDHSSDIIRALEMRLRALGVQILLHTRVQEILTDETPAEDTAREGAAMEAGSGSITGKKKKNAAPTRRVRGVRLASGRVIRADAVILATGGLSYPATGATGDGYRMAESCGHTVNRTRPALVPLETAEDWVKELQGLSLKNVTLTLGEGKKRVFSEFGEMLFTHFGISGPLALSASSYAASALENGALPAHIDLKPALSEEQLDARILREFASSPNRNFGNAAAPLFPASLRPVMVRLSGIPADRPAHAVTKKERSRFVQLVKDLPLTITGTRGFREAIITQGGIPVREVDPATMGSKKVQGLYLAGELLDVDAVTGGYNLQIAWATAHSAALAAAEPVQQFFS